MGMNWSGFSLLAIDFLHLDLGLSVRSMARYDPSAPVWGVGWMDVLSLVLDSLHLGLFAALQSLARLEATPLAFGKARSEPLVPGPGLC